MTRDLTVKGCQHVSLASSFVEEGQQPVYGLWLVFGRQRRIEGEIKSVYVSRTGRPTTRFGVVASISGWSVATEIP